jgi:predicted  nucleic acid-binding Zn-ribbon protein
MNDPRTAETTAIRLAELSHELDELETSRAALLKRVDALRATLISGGNRTTAMRASIDLLCEHITNLVTAMADLRALEAEMREIGQRLDGAEDDALRMSFESDSLSETLDEAEEELERLSSILIDGKERHPRGH